MHLPAVAFSSCCCFGVWAQRCEVLPWRLWHNSWCCVFAPLLKPGGYLFVRTPVEKCTWTFKHHFPDVQCICQAAKEGKLNSCKIILDGCEVTSEDEYKKLRSLVDGGVVELKDVRCTGYSTESVDDCQSTADLKDQIAQLQAENYRIQAEMASRSGTVLPSPANASSDGTEGNPSNGAPP